MAIVDHADTSVITARAREVRFWPSLLRLLAVVIVGAGWVTARIFSYIWLGMVWVALAFNTGWVAGLEANRSGDAPG